MVILTEHYRHILLFYFRKGKNATQARKKLCDVYGEDALSERQCQRWFAKFREGDFSFEDAPRSGRPSAVNEDQIKALLKEKRRYTTRQMGEKLNVSHVTVQNHLKKIKRIKRR
nr:histone-lysine N-methyltransferase SETMAR-like [Drosophila bipectinata]